MYFGLYHQKYKFDEQKERLLYILDKADLSTLQPYVLYLLKKYQSKEQESILNERLNDLEKFVVRRLLTGKSNKNYNKDCKSFIAEESYVKEMANEISNEEILVGINHIDNRAATIALFWIELYRRKSELKDENKLEDKYTLEHVMPQQWHEYWLDVPVKDIDDTVINDVVNAEIQRTKYIYSIGNMTLLTGRFNTSLRNYTFKRKMEGEDGKPGVIECSSLSITTRDIVEEVYKDTKKTWDEYQILLREQKLGKEIIEIWGQKDGINKIDIQKATSYVPKEEDLIKIHDTQCINCKNFKSKICS